MPTFRRDVEGEADLIEEVARIYGYDRIPATIPKGSGTQGGLSRPLPAVEQVRTLLAARGLCESITYSFISPKLFDRLRIPDGHPWRRAIRLANPLSEEQSLMRTSLVPSLVEAAALNVRRQVNDVRLFELGKVYLPRELPLKELPERALDGGPGSHGTGTGPRLGRAGAAGGFLRSQRPRGDAPRRAGRGRASL